MISIPCVSPSLSAAPTRPVRNVQAMHSSADATTVVVSWEPLTIVDARGFIEYLIELIPSVSSKRQTLSMLVPMEQSRVEFTGLDPSQGYEATVATVTSDGTVGERE